MYKLLKDPVAEIEYSKGLYDSQILKVKQEEYIKNLMFEDFVRKVKANTSRYDFFENLFSKAQEQVGKKKKKEREELAALEEFMLEDFFGDSKYYQYDFKITQIVRGGFEGYYWNIHYNFLGTEFWISIPMMKNITAENIGAAHDGRFAFAVRESSASWKVVKMSYKIEDIAESIREYFELEEPTE